MSVKSFKFVSPGVFINEIDNSFIPAEADVIGPVVIGRSTRGLAMQPVTVQSYSEFVEMFGDTVPGFAGGDIYRNGNFQSPMYGTFAAKAFLDANVAPLTYVRLLGQQDANPDSTVDAKAGWKTTNTITQVPATNGGSYGLWLFTSSSTNTVAANLGTGSLAAIFYVDDGEIYLSGNVYGGHCRTAEQGNTGGDQSDTCAVTGANNVMIGVDSDNLYTVVISGSSGKKEKIRFNFDDTSANFIRKKFNTNPQMISGATFYGNTVLSAKSYWLGESYEQELRDRSFLSKSIGVMMSVSKGADTGPMDMKSQASKEAVAGWFIGQDLGLASNYTSFEQTKLFRLIGRGHGEWLNRNCKVSIANVKNSTSTTTDYGTFSILIRSLHDTDNNVQVMERFDNLNLDPTSPNYIARVIGDKYTSWDTTERRLRTYGEYNNNSKFVYVEMNDEVEAGGTDPVLLPFGYFGPPRFRAAYDLWGTGAVNLAPYGAGNETASPQQSTLSNFFVTGGSGIVASGGRTGQGSGATVATDRYLSGGCAMSSSHNGTGDCTGSLVFPVVRLRNSASDGGLANSSDAYFGMQTTRTVTSTTSDPSIADFHRLLYTGYNAGGGQNATNPHSVAGVEDYAYVFSLDDIVLKTAGGTDFFYQSGSRLLETAYSSASYTDLLDAQINSFTAPFFGGFDGFDIKKPDPMYNTGMGSTDAASYRYYTWKRAIDTVADPEFLDMNLLAAPGLTNTGLTTHMVRVGEDRADALALIDLPSVYVPPHESYQTSKDKRLQSTPQNAANALRDRIIDSSYGATFYPWVQTRDDSGAMLWVPPSVAMMGVLASSEAASQIWFAPAGFNRGGLSEGAAGIPVVGVTQRLTSKERDTLYEANINPIASFPSTGIVVFGQKTLQERQSALDRINVRRLVIYLKKQISILSTQILFEQNVQATWNRFTALVEPFLANVKVNYGITDYRLILDESTTTADLIDQNVLYAKIMIKPARAIEYIAIDFVIMSTGASFDD